MQPKTIWYCHHYAGSPSLGMAFRPYYLTKEFCEAGHNAFVISASYHHLLLKQTFQKEPIKFSTIDNVPFIHLKTSYYKNNGISRISNMLRYVWRIYREEKRIISITGKPDVIIVSSGHPFHYPLLKKIAKKYNAKLIFEVRDLWPQSLTELLNLNQRHPLVWILSKIEKHAYRHADYVVSLLDKALPYMEQKGLDPNRFRLISNGVSVKLYSEKQALTSTVSSTISALKKQGWFLCGYTGSLGIPNAMSHFISAMAQIAAQQIPIHAVIVGEGGEKNELQTQCMQLGLAKHITFLPAIAKFEIPTFLGQMDCLYIGWSASNLYKYGVSPNKVFDYMMAGKPIIESRDTNQSLIQQFNCGITCAAANAPAIAAALIRMYHTTSTERDLMGQNAKTNVVKEFDYTVLAQKYLGLF